jgi:DNA (cytosine-5)-methyltransferase 1
MNHGSLFSGIGGFDLAAQWMGWENVMHCEINPFGQRILKHYWPNAISHHDIKTTDFTIHRGSIDILTGGFPCQPYSAAGKRLGKEDDRHLWPEMLRAIREISPCWVVGENVRGLTNWNGGMVFDEVQADLEAEGYELLPFLLPACAVNAPHRRDRIWFIAYRVSEEQREQAIGGVRAEFGNSVGATPNTAGIRRKRDIFTGETLQRPEQTCREIGTGVNEAGVTTNPSSIGQPGKEYRQEKRGRIAKEGIPNDWQNFPTVPPVCSGDDGIPRKLDGITFPAWRNESIKGFGNAVVPQVVYQIFQAIEQYESYISTYAPCRYLAYNCATV